MCRPSRRRPPRAKCRKGRRVLPSAEAIRQRLIANGYPGARIEVIRNGVDLFPTGEQPADATLRQELGLPDNAPLIAMVSRLNRARGVDFKGTEYFLDAAA